MLHADCADALVVAAPDPQGQSALWWLPAAAPGLRREALRLVDGRGAARVSCAGASAERLGPAASGATAAGAIAAARDEACVAQCAEALGAVRSLLAATVRHLRLRTQFGAPLSTQQALRHRLAEMAVLAEEIAALTRAAERALDDEPARRAPLVAGATAYVLGAARRVGNDAVQLHGGVGITEELEVSHYFRRLMAIAALCGGREQQFERYLQACEAGP